MKYPFFATLIAAASCLSATASYGAATRVALVCSGGGESGKDVLMLADVRLGEEPTVTLLDRREVQRVLQEQNLTLSGLGDSTQALALGKILRVEVFAVLEMSSEEKKPLGLVAFDAQSGMRLVDVTLPDQGAEQAAQKVAEAINAACAKRNRRPDTLQTVCLLGVRNTDLPRAMDSRCQALAAMLERSLVRSDSLVILERKRLEHVNKERTLPTATEGRELAVSVLTIDLEIARGPGGKGLRATAFVDDAAGKRIAKPQVLRADDDIAALSEALLTELLKSLSARVVPPVGDRAAEATRFCRESRILSAHRDFAGALAAGESAYALNPVDRDNASQLRFALEVAASRSWQQDDAEQVIQAFGRASRALELGRDIHRAATRPGKPLAEYSPSVSDEEFRMAVMCHASAVPIDHWPAEARPTVQEFREEYHRHLVTALTQMAADSQRSEHVLGIFVRRWNVQERRLLSDAASTSQEHVADLIAIIGRWLDAWKKRGNVPISMADGSYIGMALHFFISDSPPQHYQLRPEDYAKLRPLLQDMQKHPIPLVQDYGTWGEIWLSERCDGPSPSFEDFKTLVHEHIAQPRLKLTRGDSRRDLPGVSPVMTARRSHYRAMLDALRCLKLEEAVRRRELIELLQFMVDRRDLAWDVVAKTMSLQPADRREAERVVTLMDRVETLLDADPRGVAIGSGGISELRRRLAEWRQRMGSTWPDLVRAAPLAVPWTQSRPLLRRTDFGDVLRLVSPVINKDTLFVTGIRQSGALEAFSVPLKGGQARSLGKVASTIPRLGEVGSVGNVGGYYCVSSPTDGIVAFPLGGGQPLHIDEASGLPSNDVSAMDWLDGKLYVALGGSYLACWDPHDRTCEVLASSRSKQKRSPLDDCRPYIISYMAGDPQRHRLLLTILFRDGFEHKRDDGLWQYEPDTKVFKRIFYVAIPSLGYSRGTQVWNNSITLWFNYSSVIRVDLKTDAPTLVHAMDSDFSLLRVPGVQLRDAAYRNFAGSNPPYAEAGGWLWAVRGTFARMSKQTGAIERLPSLDTGKPGASYLYLEPIGDGSGLIVGDDSAFWLVTLKDKSSEMTNY